MFIPSIDTFEIIGPIPTLNDENENDESAADADSNWNAQFQDVNETSPENMNKLTDDGGQVNHDQDLIRETTTGTTTEKISSKNTTGNTGTFCAYVRQTCNWKWRSDKRQAKSRALTRFDIIVLFLLSLALLLATPARGHLNPLAGLIIASDKELSYSVTKHGQILFVGAVAAGLGNLVTGFLIDIYDPLWCFFFCALFSGVATLLISELHVVASPLGQNTEGALILLQVFHGMNIFFQAGLFASGAKFLQRHFRPAQYGKALVAFAIGGRIGALVGVLGMGSVVTNYASLGWQFGSRIASILCFASLAPIIILKLFFPHPVDHLVAPSPEKSGHAQCIPKAKCCRINVKQDWSTFKTGLSRIAAWCQRRSFVLMACINAGMAVAIAPEGFYGFASLFTVQGLHVTAGLPAGSVVMFIHIGAIVSLVLGGLLVETFVKAGQTKFVLISLVVACAASGAMIGISAVAADHPDNSYPEAGRAVFFFLGLGLGYAFFVSVPKFSIHFGGPYAGLVIQILSLFGLAVCAAADGVFGILAYTSWTIVAAVVCAFVLIALVVRTLFDFLEWRTRYKLKQLNLQSALRNIVRSRTRNRGVGLLMSSLDRPGKIRPKDAIQAYVMAERARMQHEQQQPQDISGYQPAKENADDQQNVEQQLKLQRRLLQIEHASFSRDIGPIVEQHERELDAAEPDLLHRRQRKCMRVMWASLSSILALVVVVALFVSYIFSRAAALRQQQPA